MDGFKFFTITAVVWITAATVALTGSHHGAVWQGYPLFIVCGFLAFAIQWLGFLPSYIFQTEKFFDLIGSLTYISITLIASLAAFPKPVTWLLAIPVLIWAARLGSFLFLRIHKAGKDERFDTIKTDFGSFFLTWNLQGLWILLTLGAALAAITSKTVVAVTWVEYLGLAIWILGFTIEAIADRQKNIWRQDPANSGKFIQHGLWSWSRHPNYFGEITLWTGITVIAARSLSGWQYVTLVSPAFVAFLLINVSGIPLLAERGWKKWGSDPNYQEYLRRTSRLIPMPPKR